MHGEVFRGSWVLLGFGFTIPLVNLTRLRKNTFCENFNPRISKKIEGARNIELRTPIFSSPVGLSASASGVPKLSKSSQLLAHG